MKPDRKLLGKTFDQAADIYQRARPEYPVALFDTLVGATRLRPGDRLLEIGCATGKATVSLARRGFVITALEPGPALAAAARHHLATFPEVTVIESDFESWRAARGSRFDLIYAATAWHWVDPEIRYRKAWELLRSDGFLALWGAGHVFPDDGDTFFYEIQEIYEEIGEHLPLDARWPKPGEQPDNGDEIEASGLFDVVEIRNFDWEVQYDAEEYIDLLNTFSGHIAMREWQRDRLYTEIRCRLSKRPERSVRRHWGAVLHIAQRKSNTAAARE